MIVLHFLDSGHIFLYYTGEEKMPSCGDYIMHFLTLPWKLIFAFIPPTGQVSYIFLVKY